MIGEILVDGLGVTARVQVEEGTRGAELDHELLAELQRVWSRARVTRGKPSTTVTISLRDAAPERADDGRYVVGADVDSVLTSATQQITYALIEQRVGTRLMLHAGCVAHPETGEALAFVAAGGTGKTTLTAGLCQRYAYVSDKTVCIDADGIIEPYQKPLSVVGAGIHHKAERSPDDFGLVRLQVEPVLTGLVLIERDPALTEVLVEEVPLLDAIEAMAPQSSSLYRLPEPLQFFARTIDMVDGVQRWTYGDWQQVEHLVEQRLGAPE